jgi:sugar lactone lactonase YvrE
MRLLSVLLTLGISWSAWGQTYTISTFAGGALPVNIPGTSASLGYAPRYVAADPAGNVFFVYQNTVLRLDAATGVLTLAAGDGTTGFGGDNGPATSAQLNGPTGVTVDSAGNLYIADTLNNRIREVSGSVISTVAGTGTSGIGGDNGPATGALFSGPTGVAVDSNGNLYIADALNRRIRKVSSTGVIVTVAGGGTSLGENVSATKAQLGSSLGIAVDSAGILYIADTDNNRIRKVSAGLIATVVGNGTRGFSGDNGPATGARLALPSGIALDSAGNLYIADTDNNRVREVSNGVITTVAGGRASLGDNGPATGAQLNSPTGVAVDSAGNLYIADFGDSRIRKVSNATITTIAGNATPGFGGDNGPAASAQLANPYGLAIDPAGNLYIADSSNNLIRKVSNGVVTTVAGNGTPGFSGDNGPATSAQLNGPTHVAVDSAGNLYIADTLNNLIREVSNGVIATVAGIGTPGFGGDGGPATSAQLYAPSGIAVDSAGNLYIADSANNRIREVSGGVMNTVAGTGTPGFSGDGGPAINAQLYAPSGIAVDATGNLYIADTFNGSIRKVSNGVIATVAGNGTPGFGGDNGLASGAQLNNPYGLVVDSAGNLYIADTGDQRIRRISSSGVIATVAGTGSPGFSGDNGPAINAQLDNPYGLAVDSAGKVYIADFDNNRVRVLTPIVPCAYSLSPTAAQAAISGGNLTVGIRTAASCSWAVAGLPGWIVVSGASSGLGSASVTLVVAPNSGASLSATILIGGASFTVTQPAAAACVYSLSPGGQAFGLAGGTGTINITVSTGCPWAAASNASWISITGGNSGNGNGSVTFQAAPNPGAARSGTVSVAGLLSFTVEEADALLTGFTSAGSITHLASGGYWTTTITLLNTGSLQAKVRLNFFDDNGNPLALPLTFPQSSSASAAGPLLASTLDRTLKPGAQLVVQSTGPNSQPTLAGWAQVLTNGALGGFAVFSQAIGNSNQQAEVPLDTGKAGDYVVPFDNTNGSSTAIALANIFVQAITTAVSIRDDAGNVILSDQITLPAMGHSSFSVADRYGSVTAQRRGTLEFTTPSPGLISVLGLSFNATGAFSTIPTIAK